MSFSVNVQMSDRRRDAAQLLMDELKKAWTINSIFKVVDELTKIAPDVSRRWYGGGSVFRITAKKINMALELIRENPAGYKSLVPAPPESSQQKEEPKIAEKSTKKGFRRKITTRIMAKITKT